MCAKGKGRRGAKAKGRAEKRRERERERERRDVRGGTETESREIERVQSAFTIGL